MRAEITEGQKGVERVRAKLRQGYLDSLPYLDKSIPLGKPSLEDAFAIKRYYARKHARGEFGTYWPLHQLGEAQFGVMRSLGGRK